MNRTARTGALATALACLAPLGLAATPADAAVATTSRGLTTSQIAKRSGICGKGFTLKTTTAIGKGAPAIRAGFKNRDGSVLCTVVFNNRTHAQYLRVVAKSQFNGRTYRQYSSDAGTFRDYAGPVKLRRSGTTAVVETSVGRPAIGSLVSRGRF